MTRARDIADIWSREYQTDALYSSGYTEARTLDGTSLTVTRAVRVIKGESHDFTNLSFSVPMDADVDVSEWADTGDWKWSYLYVRPGDEKFFLSDTAPNRGENFRTFDGEDVAYLFPIWINGSAIHSFVCSGNEFTITEVNGVDQYQTNTPGMRLAYKTNVPHGGDWYDYDVTEKIPGTALLMENSFHANWGQRYDAGGTAQSHVYLKVSTANTGTEHYLARFDKADYLKTPGVGNHYQTRSRIGNKAFTVSTDVFDFSTSRIYFYTNAGQADGFNCFAWNLLSFIDRSIF